MVDAQQFLERVPEFRAEDGVQDGVQRRVKIAQPQEERDHVLVKVTRRADWQQYGDHKERQPADHESARDYSLYQLKQMHHMINA